MPWTAHDIPALTNRTALITGGNTGLGFASGLALARKDARVLLACRRLDAGHQAAERIMATVPTARVEVVELDLIDPASIAECARTVAAHTTHLDLLLNNAGVVNLPTLRRTPAGHEMHMATNHYGHFALTGHLFPLLVKTPAARVVTVTSPAYRLGVIDFTDLDWRTRTYSRTHSYGDSKLANLLFMSALQQRFEAVGASALSLAAHPGLTATERQQTVGIGGWIAHWLASPVEHGVRSLLRAATDPNARTGECYGPRFGLRGPASRITLQQPAYDMALANQLWDVTTHMTQVRYALD